MITEYSREEILELLEHNWKWDYNGQYWYNEDGLHLSPGDIMILWKSAEEINKQLLEASKLVMRLWGKLPSPMTYNKVEAAVMVAEGR